MLERAGIARPPEIVLAVTGDDEDNIVISQIAKEGYRRPEGDRARQRPAEPAALRPARDHADDLRDVGAARPRRARGPAARPREAARAAERRVSRSSSSRPRGRRRRRASVSPGIALPEGAKLVSVMRNGVAELARDDTVVRPGDQVIAILKPGRRRAAPQGRRRLADTSRASPNVNVGGEWAAMTLAELAVTIALLGILGLAASRFGLSAIPAYLFAGIILGPNDPDFIRLVQPSEVTEFVAEIGLIFLLFFLGLEFSVERLVRSGRHVGLGGAADLLVNAGLGLLVGVGGLRRQLRRVRRRGVRLRLVERDRGEGADRLPPARRRRDRSRARDPPLRGRRDRSRPRLRRDRRWRGGDDGARDDEGARLRRRLARGLALARCADRPAPLAARARVLPARRVRLRRSG